MLPGPHRVLVDSPRGAARQYRVAVPANRQARLAIDWEVDSVLVTADWVGFQLATDEDHEREGLLARKLAGDRTSAVMIAVVSATRAGRRLVVRGTLHAVVSGKVARSGRVELTGRGDSKKLDQLAAFIGFQQAGADVTVMERVPPAALPLREPAPPRPWPCTCGTRGGEAPRDATRGGGKAPALPGQRGWGRPPSR